MMLTILIILKTILFASITRVENNLLLVLTLTSLVSLLVLSLIEMRAKKNKGLYQLIFYSIISLIIFIDVMHYSYFEELPSLAQLGQVGQLGVVGSSIIRLLTWKNIIFILDLPILIYLKRKGVKGLKRLKYNPGKDTIGRIAITSAIGIMIIVGVTFASDASTILTNQELYSYHIGDIVDTYFLDEVSGSNNPEEVLQMMREKEEVSGEKKHYGIGKDRNLIVVQIESLQDFVIGMEVGGEEVTPHINRFIQDQSSLYFDEFYQLINRGNTSDAEFVVNNSLHPSNEEPSYSQYENNTFYGLPWRLRDEGYNAWVFHGYKKEFWNRRAAYPAQGFQRFLSEEDFHYEEQILFGISDREFYEQTIDYLLELDAIDDNPFYSFIITLSSHTPYNMDEKYHVLDIEEPQKGTIVGDYLHAIHYADQEFGNFLEALKREGLYDNSVIAIYGDHYGINNADEEVFIPMEDILGEPYNFDHIMNIPLVINVPGEGIKETISKIGSQIDFYPTILNIMGLENEKGYMMGMDLVNSEEYNYVAPQRVLRRGSFIDDDVIFNIARDGIFSNSQARDRKTREEVDINRYRSTYDRVINDISTSDIILKNDLFKYLLNDEDIDGEKDSKHGKLPEQEVIHSLDELDIIEMNAIYNVENRIIRLNVDRNTDLYKLERWMIEHPGAYLILHSEEGDMELLEEIKDDYKELRDRYIGEIGDVNDYFLIQRRGYKNLILDTRGKGYKEKELLDYLDLNEHFALIVEEKRIRKRLASKIRDRGIRVYVVGETGSLMEY